MKTYAVRSKPAILLSKIAEKFFIKPDSVNFLILYTAAGTERLTSFAISLAVERALS